MHQKKFITTGQPVSASSKALIMIHGRGATAEDIINLSQCLFVNEFSVIAPQATNYTWYPYSFLARLEQNEPWLSSALQLLKELTDDLLKQNIPTQNIYLLGFSQGACLSLEFAARNANRYGGVIAFTGGLIGDRIYEENYKGDFSGTPVFMGTSDPDPHVPIERFRESALILEKMNARVTKREYPNLGHTISQDEINTVNSMFFKYGE